MAGTVIIAFVLIGSAVIRRPFTQRFAHDFCPLDPALLARPHVQRFFVRISLLWATVLLVNTGLVLFVHVPHADEVKECGHWMARSIPSQRV